MWEGRGMLWGIEGLGVVIERPLANKKGDNTAENWARI
jgi:hypothetical protein